MCTVEAWVYKSGILRHNEATNGRDIGKNNDAIFKKRNARNDQEMQFNLSDLYASFTVTLSTQIGFTKEGSPKFWRLKLLLHSEKIMIHPLPFLY